MRILLTTVLFLSIATAAYSVGALLTFEHDMLRWPASFQVGWVMVTVFCTVLMYALLGINDPEEFEDDRR